MMNLQPQYQTELRPILWLLFGLGAILLASWLSPALPLFQGIAAYPPLHTLLETISIVVSILVFGVCWASSNKEQHGNITLLATVFLGVALLDFLHTLSIMGMPDFITPGGTEKAINFWLAARYLFAFGLIAVALRPWRPARSQNARWIGLVAILVLVGSVAWVGLMHQNWFPRTFIPGEGLTSFKLASEYVLVAMYAMAAFLFLRHMRARQPYDVVGLFAAACVTALSELYFTLYAADADVFLILGHVYKVLAYAFVYKSIFVDNIRLPYQRLNQANQLLAGEIEERERTEELLRVSEERWKFALEGAGDGVWDWNVQTGNVHFSKRWKQMLGYAENELSGSLEDWEQRVHPEDKEHVMAALQGQLQGASDYSVELRLRCKDGSWKWVLDRGMVVSRDADGKPLRMIGTIADISERKLHEEELRQANELLEVRVAQRTRELSIAKMQAEAASEAKSQFLANMSHDIRTPMNSIIGMSILALKTGLDPKQRDYIEKIHQSGQNLLGLINDILDISKVEAGKLGLEMVDFWLDNLIDQLRSQLSEISASKGLKLTFDVDPVLFRTFQGDPLRLMQVLTNYVGNAIKFTDQGEVAVRVRLLEENADSSLVYFEVEDTGIGIDEAEMGHLFQAFHQADASTTRKYGGSGLGLAISKKLVEMMGGEVGVDSTPGQGSTFWFTVRFKNVASTAGQKSGVVAHMANLDGVLGAAILLVEDNAFNQQVASELLQSAGARVAIAGNGQEALDVLRTQRFDCVLMDVQMPLMDGYETTRRIRAHHELAGMPVIAMTANARNEDRMRCRDAGMDDFITKPLDPNLMFATLDKWLGQRALATDKQLLAAGRQVSGVAAGQTTEIDLAVLAKMWGNDPDKVRKYAVMFAQSIRDDLAAIEAALAEGDMQRLGELGHRAKSSARTVGAHGFADACFALERLGQSDDLAAAQAIVETLRGQVEQITVQVDKAFV